MGILGRHHAHLPRHYINKAAEGMDDKRSGFFGRQVAKGQGQSTKADAKTPPIFFLRGKK